MNSEQQHETTDETINKSRAAWITVLQHSEFNIDELDSAESEWQAAQAAVNSINMEMLTAKR